MLDDGEAQVTQKEPSRSRTQSDLIKGENKALDILYATPDPKDDLSDLGKRDLPAALREKYWIEQAKDAGIRTSPDAVRFVMPWDIERQELGRSRNDPGDGFRYVLRGGASGFDGRPEWFEVTEVFESVQAQEIETFMRIRNGIAVRRAFDPLAFLNGLDLGTPGRVAQRRAADSVIVAVGRKLAKSSYRDMTKAHGFGTLIVGLPLWFASYAADPFRPENVIDDFVTRVSIGLQPHVRRLRSRECPFWRIVVIWNTTARSMREWSSRLQPDQYDDPALWSLTGIPAIPGPLAESFVDLMPDGITLHIARALPEKLQERVQLPPRMAPILRHVDNVAVRHRVPGYQRLKLRVLMRCLGLVRFVRVRGLAGLRRYFVVRLSPCHYIDRSARARRAQRLYRASMLPPEARRRARTRRRSRLGRD